jgi:hypothetical protein
VTIFDSDIFLIIENFSVRKLNSLANINLETITIKSNTSILAEITNVNLELILRVSIYVKHSNGKFVQQKFN